MAGAQACRLLHTRAVGQRLPLLMRGLPAPGATHSRVGNSDKKPPADRSLYVLLHRAGTVAVDGMGVIIECLLHVKSPIILTMHTMAKSA